MIRAIYRTSGGKRVVRQALFTCGRKNGKTQLAAALAACHLAGPEAEPRGEVYSAAADVRPAGERWEKSTRELRSLDLVEISVVGSFPAYQTEVHARSRAPLRLVMAQRFLETV